jgi:pumilio RNA-binding family
MVEFEDKSTEEREALGIACLKDHIVEAAKH